MKRYLVTGGAGFIGSHIVDKLVQKGIQVRVLDNLSSGSLDVLKHLQGKFEFIQGDIRDAEIVKKAVTGVDAVLHQAALRSIPKSLLAPKDYHDVNVTGTFTLLHEAAAAKVKKFVFASSSSVYGQVVEFPQREGKESSPISPYALSKKIGEEYCRVFSTVFGLPTVALRYFNIYGPGQNLDDDYSAVIPKFIANLLKNEPVPIYGDGEQSRDFTFIDNVVEANLAAAENSSTVSEIVNIACGSTTSVNVLAQKLGELIGCQAAPRYLPARAGDVKKSHADISRLKSVLGLTPGVSLEEGLKKTVQWFREKK